MGGSKKSLWQRLKKQGALQLFVLAGMLYLVIFNFIPMFGLVMGFKDYTISSGIKGIFTSEWVGLKYFKEFVTDYKFGKLVRNTVALSVLKLIFTFPLPILFALMVNEIKKSQIQEASADMQLSAPFYILGHNIQHFISIFVPVRNY